MLKEITYEQPDGLVFTENVEVEDSLKGTTSVIEEEVEYIGQITSGLLRDKDATLLKTKDGKEIVAFYNSDKDVYQPSTYREGFIADPNTLFEKQELRDQLTDLVHNSQLNPLSDSFISNVFDFMRKNNIQVVRQEKYIIETIPNTVNMFFYTIPNEKMEVVYYDKKENRYERLVEIKTNKKNDK